MTRQFNVVVERDAEGFFVATVPSLPELPHAGTFVGSADGTRASVD